MPLWIDPKPLVLASKSDVRRHILAGAGLPVEIIAALIDERGEEARAGITSALEAAQLLARAKALAVSADLPGRLVLGADQTLALGDATSGERRFSKPANRAGAGAQLRALAGKTHRLYSAIALVRGGEILFEQSDTAQLTMRDFSDRFLESYLDTAGERATASVGGYQVENVGIHLFSRVEGDHFTILGLPLLPLLDFLRRSGLIAA